MSRRTVSIRDDSIRLGQFLKLADLIDQGADARQAITDGRVRVNGEIERRRSRQPTHGDEIEVRGEFVEVG